MKKQMYTRLEISPVSFEPESSILKGSVTMTPMKVQNVSVNNYEDGFATEGGFKEVTFD